MIHRKICVVGLGYVGLPVALCFARHTPVIAFDINKKRVTELQQGVDANNENSEEDFTDIEITYTSNVSDLCAADFYIVTVPTPINKTNQPDLSALQSASEIIAECLNQSDIVVYESTVYPGMTEEYCVPILEEKSKLIAGQDFFVGYSPERISPGDKQHTFVNIKKIVSGQTEETCDLIAEVYGTVISAGIYKVPSIKVAEAAKIVENTQRDVNIALMNELAVIFDKMGIDTMDVLQAAETKWNFLPFRPGLVGGHCISVDPHYLIYVASVIGYKSRIIEVARNLNDSMAENIVDRTINAMEKNKCGSDVVTILGLTFKENVRDLRNSGALEIVNALLERGMEIQVHDPIADVAEVKSIFNMNLTAFENIKPAGAVIVTVAHQYYQQMDWSDIALLLNERGVIFDIKSIFPRVHVSENITLLRL